MDCILNQFESSIVILCTKFLIDLWKPYFCPPKTSVEALRWKDVFFKCSTMTLLQVLIGGEVSKAGRVTLSLLSSKNVARRCTQTTFLVPNARVNATRQLKELYLRILDETGKVPNPEDAVFKLTNGEPMTRKTVSKRLQDILESVGVPRKFAGSHNLRRGGANLYRACATSDDESVKRFGRWTSDAYKLYIHVESSMIERWAAEAAALRPIFE